MNTDHRPLVALLLLVSSALGSGTSVQEACRVTRYRRLCEDSLGLFSAAAKRSPIVWARAGVSVTIGEVKAVSPYLGRVRRSGLARGRARGAIDDCVEVVQDGLDYLHQALYVLRSLNSTEFEGQMSDVLTWLSTALTDEETCLEGLAEVAGGGRRWRRWSGSTMVWVVKNKVTYASYFISNALALANNLAISGSSSSTKD